MTGLAFTSRITGLVVAGGVQLPVMLTRKLKPAWLNWALSRVRLSESAPIKRASVISYVVKSASFVHLPPVGNIGSLCIDPESGRSVLTGSECHGAAQDLRGSLHGQYTSHRL